LEDLSQWADTGWSAFTPALSGIKFQIPYWKFWYYTFPATSLSKAFQIYAGMYFPLKADKQK